jgi:hypothetical protein
MSTEILNSNPEPNIDKVVLYAVSVVCEVMRTSTGEKVPCEKYLPVYDTIEEARQQIAKVGYGQLIELSKDGM